ncbi:hypothetical protein GCM10027570_27150 [Streptomonospora sediminis]
MVTPPWPDAWGPCPESEPTVPTDRKKKAARALAARTGWSYTAELRRLDTPDRPFDPPAQAGR